MVMGVVPGVSLNQTVAPSGAPLHDVGSPASVVEPTVDALKLAGNVAARGAAAKLSLTPAARSLGVGGPPLKASLALSAASGLLGPEFLRGRPAIAAFADPALAGDTSRLPSSGWGGGAGAGVGGRFALAAGLGARGARGGGGGGGR